MKQVKLHVFRSLAAITVFGLLLLQMSCSSDDDSSPSNTFTVGDKTIKIKTAVLKYDPQANEGDGADYNHNLAFLSEGLSIEGDMAVGTGSAIDFGFYSNDAKLETSELTYTGEENVVAYEIWGAWAEFDYTSGFYDGIFYKVDGVQYNSTEGNLSVKKSGSTYTIKYTGKAVAEGTETEVDVAVQYTGAIIEVARD